MEIPPFFVILFIEMKEGRAGMHEHIYFTVIHRT